MIFRYSYLYTVMITTFFGGRSFYRSNTLDRTLLGVHETARSQTDARSHILVRTYLERRVGLCSTWAFLWFGFPAPALSIDLNSNSDKTYKVTPMIKSRIKSLQTTQTAFLIRNAIWVSGGGGGDVQNIFVQGSVQGENRMKPLVRTSFLGTRPSGLPSPGWPFFCGDDRKPNL